MKASYKYKFFTEIEDLVFWLNNLEDMGDFIYNVDGVFSTPRGIYVVLDGYGKDWHKI